MKLKAKIQNSNKRKTPKVLKNSENAVLKKVNAVIKNTIDDEERQSYNEEDLDAIEIICAKHILWIYDGSDGEKADFSNCRLTNINFDDKMLCGANFKNATLKNCTFNDASICSVDFSGATFDNCDFKNAVAEESNLKNATFKNTNLFNTYFTHSNLTNARFENCNMDNTSLVNNCIQNCLYRNCNTNTVDFRGTNYDEESWLCDENESSMTFGGM
jgi:uncharacterized protein YjbI with pentapeptide repeats